jgi:predicted AAA+ superfamily ATPase
VIERPRHFQAVRSALSRQPVVALVGARQVGKTTLARAVARGFDGPTHHFDLEDEEVLARLSDAPLALDRLRGLVVLDEIQRRPEIFPPQVLSNSVRFARFLVRKRDPAPAPPVVGVPRG